MPDIQAVTLDFYRTLARHGAGGGRGRVLMDYFATQGIASDPWRHQILYDVFEPHAREYSPRLSAPAKEAYLTRLCGRLFEQLGVSREKHDPAVHALEVWEVIGPSSMTLYSDVHDALERLRAAGYPLAVLSNWQCGLGHFCDELGVGSYFDHVVASAEVGHDKPSPGIFAEAAGRLGVPGEHILHVGDTVEDDLNGARAAGWHAVLIDRAGDHTASDTPLVRSLSEVPTLLERWLRV